MGWEPDIVAHILKKGSPSHFGPVLAVKSAALKEVINQTGKLYLENVMKKKVIC